nr:hypothetical protein [Tanacetum cinerariifolium]
MFHEMMQQQFVLDREAKMAEMKNETSARVELLQSRTQNENLMTLAINIGEMDPTDMAIIEEAKEEIRPKYFPQS